MNAPRRDPPMETQDRLYTERLITRSSARWKRLLNVQAPYRWNIRRLEPGFVLDIGCGVGRNLLHLDGHGVGVDHNPHSIEVARAAGLTAFTNDDFQASPYATPGRFDAMLLAHLAEHLTRSDLVELLRAYLPLLKPGGRAILITPQEAGYRSDPTHVRFVDFAAVDEVCREVGLTPARRFSFPFPRPVGRLFKYNEFVVEAVKPTADAAGSA